MLSEHVPNFTHEIIDSESQKFYGGRFMVCETIMESAAHIIADRMGFVWEGNEMMERSHE